MKKITTTILAVLSTTILFAQVPQAFKYQALVRDTTGEVIANDTVSFQISILQGSATGIAIYIETHDTITNKLGLVNLDIGNGDVVSGSFADIDWGMENHFLQIELDEDGGTDYQLVGTTQLLSVPYSINSGSITLVSPDGKKFEIKVDNDGNLNTNCLPPTSIPNAGTDIEEAISPVTLSANAPEVGTGQWTTTAGHGFYFSDPNDPQSLFYAMPDRTYYSTWTISSPCGSLSDNVSIEISDYDPYPCPGISSVVDIDGNNYNTTQIGPLCLMAENLKTTNYRNGSPIQHVTNSEVWDTLTRGALTYYENNLMWKDTYGVLYNWYAVDDTNGLCPTGWHVPTYDEWFFLDNYVNQYIGWYLKSCRQVNSPQGDTCSTVEHPRWDESSSFGVDKLGFSGLPGGIRKLESNQGFQDLGMVGYWWASTNTYTNGYYYSLWHYANYSYISNMNQITGMSVRCIKD